MVKTAGPAGIPRDAARALEGRHCKSERVLCFWKKKHERETLARRLDEGPVLGEASTAEGDPDGKSESSSAWCPSGSSDVLG